MMDEDFDDDDDDDDEQEVFPLDDLSAELSEIVALLRGELPGLPSRELQRIAPCLYVLERLPRSTPSILFTLTIGLADRSPEVQTSGGITNAWADIDYEENILSFRTGAHHYSPTVGGDTESSIVFECFTGGDRRGSLRRWLASARSLLAQGATIECDGDGLEGEFSWPDEDE